MLDCYKLLVCSSSRRLYLIGRASWKKGPSSEILEAEMSAMLLPLLGKGLPQGLGHDSCCMHVRSWPGNPYLAVPQLTVSALDLWRWQIHQQAQIVLQLRHGDGLSIHICLCIQGLHVGNQSGLRPSHVENGLSADGWPVLLVCQNLVGSAILPPLPLCRLAALPQPGLCSLGLGLQHRVSIWQAFNLLLQLIDTAG